MGITSRKNELLPQAIMQKFFGKFSFCRYQGAF